MLESIAYGADPKVTPRDRLQAIEMLRLDFGVNGELDDLDPEQIHAELDSFYSALTALVFASPELEPDAEHYPQTAARIKVIVDLLVEREVGTRLLNEPRFRAEPFDEPEPEPEPDYDADAEAEDFVERPALPMRVPDGIVPVTVGSFDARGSRLAQ